MPYSALIIGCGNIAGGYDADRPDNAPRLSHAGAIERDDRIELVACIDPDTAKREAFAKRWSVPRHAADLASLGANPQEFDLVIIASPTQFHAEHLEAVLELRPQAVICEKPLGESLASAERMAATYEQAGIPLAVNYSRRWAPVFSDLPTADHLISAVGFYGKGILHNGCHMVDTLQMMLGPLSVHSVGPERFDYVDHDPTVSAILTTESGAPVHLVAGDCRAFTQFEIILTFPHAEIAIRNGGSSWETRKVIGSATYAGHRTLGSSVSCQEDAMDCAMQNLIADAARLLDDSGKHDMPVPKCTAREAISAQRICQEIRRQALQKMRETECARS